MIHRSTVPLERSVLIVDRSEESREVFRLALERKGMKIFETDNATTGLELAQRHNPGLIVLDMEAETADDAEVRDRYDAQSVEQNVPLVVLGTVRRQAGRGGSPAQFVSKPYHYGPLIRTIQQLLEGSQVAEPSGSNRG